VRSKVAVGGPRAEQEDLRYSSSSEEVQGVALRCHTTVVGSRAPAHTVAARGVRRRRPHELESSLWLRTLVGHRFPWPRFFFFFERTRELY
jgi:hypothetical protein